MNEFFVADISYTTCVRLFLYWGNECKKSCKECKKSFLEKSRSVPWGQSHQVEVPPVYL